MPWKEVDAQKMVHRQDPEPAPQKKPNANYSRRDVRRLTMQLLYQTDMGGAMDLPALLAGIDPEVGPLEMRREAAELALKAWGERHEADRLAVELAPDWPTHRQPPVDRAILRLAYHEITSGHAPPKVAINEAVELAKVFCAENAPAFVNGVLDKMVKRLEQVVPPMEGREELPPVE
jgi:transcription antitermination protein NusB